MLAGSENFVQKAKAKSTKMTKVSILGDAKCEQSQNPQVVANPRLKLENSKKQPREIGMRTQRKRMTILMIACTSAVERINTAAIIEENLELNMNSVRKLLRFEKLSTQLLEDFLVGINVIWGPFDALICFLHVDVNTVSHDELQALALRQLNLLAQQMFFLIRNRLLKKRWVKKIKIIRKKENKSVKLGVLGSYQDILYMQKFCGVKTTPAMWRSLGLALALCLLPWGGTESQGESSFCKTPPAWNIRDQDPMLNSYGSASRLEDLRVKLEKEGYSNISYVVVNHQGISSQLKYIHLKNKVSENIPVYQQEENQTDVWTLLNGDKDDFLVYDRCGRLVYHLGLPYSFLTFPYVEEAIKSAYCEKKCGKCSLTTLEDEDFCKTIALATVDTTTEDPQPHHHHQHHHHKHGHQHVGNSQLSENQQPEAPDAPEHPPPLGLHHHHKHKGQQRQDHPEN
ncbi:hypothetical protein HPG69_003378 [Diceros bicornis minor]|uniref:Selenoprotein P N-terminal domain-containing protein n=1 Tax=Diceros bicornis minor TaxID=77932 RepID=A0A7J7E910_DICBM|nr:hypothetical protein HPG69_003378 [Diceros bicornis minor]